MLATDIVVVKSVSTAKFPAHRNREYLNKSRKFSGPIRENSAPVIVALTPIRRSCFGTSLAHLFIDLPERPHERGCTPHVSQNNSNRGSTIDARTTRHPGHRISTIKRKQIEEAFGWVKTVGGLRKIRHRGRTLVEWFFVLTATAYNLVRIPKFWPHGISLSGV
jgi:hypothetical protein